MSDPVDHPSSQPDAASTNWEPPAAPDLPAPQPDSSGDVPWRRLSWLALLRGVLSQSREVLFLLVAIIASQTLGRANPDVGGVAIVVIAGAAISMVATIGRVVSQRYRLNGDVFEKREGLIGKKFEQVTTERIRTIALNRSAVDRVLGLASLNITTGTDGRPIALDGLTVGQANSLHKALTVSRDRPQVGRSDHTVGAGGAHESGAAQPSATTTAPATPDEPLLRGRPAWAVRAAFASAGLATFGIALAVVSPIATIVFGDDGFVDSLGRLFVWLWNNPVFLLAYPVIATIAEGGRYVLAHHHFVLRRSGPSALTTTQGLLQVRTLEMNLDRFRGVIFHTTMRGRLLGVARLDAELTTGLAVDVASGKATMSIPNQLVPLAPIECSRKVCDELMPLPRLYDVAVQQHGPVAARRLIVRALITCAIVAAAAGVGVYLQRSLWPVLIVAGVICVRTLWGAILRYRVLGHALTREHFIVRDGAFSRSHAIIERRAAIGIELSANLFQRRSGVTHLRIMNTTDGHHFHDLTTKRAAAIAHDLKPELVAPFLEATTPT